MHLSEDTQPPHSRSLKERICSQHVFPKEQRFYLHSPLNTKVPKIFISLPSPPKAQNVSPLIPIFRLCGSFWFLHCQVLCSQLPCSHLVLLIHDLPHCIQHHEKCGPTGKYPSSLPGIQFNIFLHLVSGCSNFLIQACPAFIMTNSDHFQKRHSQSRECALDSFSSHVCVFWVSCQAWSS